MDSHNILSLLGLALRGGNLAVGEEPVEAVARARDARVLLAPRDGAGTAGRREGGLGRAGVWGCRKPTGRRRAVPTNWPTKKISARESGSPRRLLSLRPLNPPRRRPPGPKPPSPGKSPPGPPGKTVPEHGQRKTLTPTAAL